MKQDRLAEMEAERAAIDDAVRTFLDRFELVFDNDWDMTKDCIASGGMISPKGTFLDPAVGDESNNWANRGSLLNSYRSLKALLNPGGGKV